MFELDNKSIDIISSRDELRNKLIEYVKDYMELENVNLHKTSFLSYIINVLSILSSNQLYYSSTVFREFFLTQAQMLESVLNLSKWIGYNTEYAEPAEVDILFTIPLNFEYNETNFIIPDNFKVKNNDIIYSINDKNNVYVNKDEIVTQFKNSENNINIEILNNQSMSVRSPNGFFYPVLYDKTNKTASFLLPFKQYEKIDYPEVHVPGDLVIYQFWSFPIEFNGMLWKIDVYYQENDNTPWVKLEQAENNTLYTLGPNDQRYITINKKNKIELFFGNGVIGKQLKPNSKVKVDLYITKGEEGRVIAGTLNESDRLYFTDNINSIAKNIPIKLTVTNPNSAYGGKNEPSIAEIKSRAIANLTSKQRFVSEQDYKDINYIIPNTPIGDSFPVLIRSDLKTNEIRLYTKLKYKNEICPTKNVFVNLEDVEIIDDVIPSKTNITIDDDVFQTLFKINLDMENNIAYYEYLIDEINVNPVLTETSDLAVNSYIIINAINFKLNDNTRQIEVNAPVTNMNLNSEVKNYYCEIIPSWDITNGDDSTSVSNIMITDYDTDDNDDPYITNFSYVFDDYLNIPTGNLSFKFNIYAEFPNYLLKPDQSNIQLISTYDCQCMIKKDLSNFMFSEITNNLDGDEKIKIHNVPVILKSYMDYLQQNNEKTTFENITLQTLINNIDINKKKMITDFINLKFCNTYGKLTNMKYNIPNLQNVIAKDLLSIPLDPDSGDRYIVNGTEDPSWIPHINKIATYVNDNWQFRNCQINDMIYINNEDKKYVWSGTKWIIPEFNIPIIVHAKIKKNNLISITSNALVENIKLKLIEHFANTFGIDKNIDRSEIIKVIRSVPGVEYVSLIKPEIDVIFNYDVPNSFDSKELLNYTPEIVSFNFDSISIFIE